MFVGHNRLYCRTYHTIYSELIHRVGLHKNQTLGHGCMLLSQIGGDLKKLLNISESIFYVIPQRREHKAFP